MKEIIRKYKDRLINISARNRSLLLRRIYKRRSLDLVEVLSIQDKKPEELLDQLMTNSDKRCLILDGSLNIKGIMEKMAEEYGRVEEKEVASKVEEVKKAETNIKYLDREIAAQYKETGKHELYLAYPFIEGKFNDGSLVRAPLYLLPLDLIKKNNMYYIQRAGEIILNKVLFFAAAKSHGISPDDFLQDLNPDDLISQSIKELDKIGIRVNRPKSGGTKGEGERGEIIKYRPERLEAYTKDSQPNFMNGELYIREYVILGQFPIASSIYRDYEYLEEMNDFPDQLESLLINKALVENKEMRAFKDSQPIYPISKLDYSQEKALRKMNTSRELVIYGPPGTGKSQTIANMISDSLVKGKRVLVISEKRAALDVLYNRLASIKDKLMLIHDSQRDKKYFMEKILSVLNEGVKELNIDIRLKRDKKYQEMQEKISELEKLENHLSKKQGLGISLQDMFVNSSEIKSDQDERYKYYLDLLDNQEAYKLIKKTSYDDLSKIVGEIKGNYELIEAYRAKKDLDREYIYLSSMQRVYGFLEKDEIKRDVRGLFDLDRPIKLLDPIKVNILYKQILKDPQYNTLKEEEIINIAKDYTDEKNSNLLEKDLDKWDIRGLISKHINRRQIAKNKQEYEKEEKKNIKEFIEISKIINKIIISLTDIMKNMEQGAKIKVLSLAIEEKNPAHLAKDLLDNLDKMDDYFDLSRQAKEIDETKKIIIDHVMGYKDMARALDLLTELAILVTLRDLEQTEEFNEFKELFEGYQEKVDFINARIEELEAYTPDIVKGVANDRLQLHIGSKAYKEMKRQAGKKSRQLSIRKMIEEFEEIIFTIFPCFLLSPETVSDILPLKAGMFDLIIFDEASQIFIESAIPSIYRGKNIVIAGDDKQLRPTSTFLARYDNLDEEELSLENAAALEEESLLDLARVNYDRINLNYHYRAKFEELIQFSNYAFYGGKLNIAPNLKSSFKDGSRPIQRIKLKGIWEDRKNHEEAVKVVELVEKILKERKEQETIGIICFNIKQRDYIEDMLEARTIENEKFRDLYFKEKNRLDGGEDISIFVKNIENVQGDERDIIIFSTAYAPDSQGRLSVNFGSLSQEGGENRLNVAISRAKRKIYIVTSIEAEELNVENTKNRGAKLLKDYLAYCRAVSEDNKVQINKILFSLSQTRGEEKPYEDNFIRSLKRALQDKGLKTESNVGRANYQLSLALINEEEYILGIDTDSSIYKKDISLKERDIYREEFYRARQWRIYRAWAYDWWRNKEGLIRDIEVKLTNKHRN